MKNVHISIDGKIVIEKCGIATGFFSRFLGLMCKKRLSKKEAIYFPNCNSVHTFFMRFPIDVVFVDDKLRIQKIKESVKPWRLILPHKNIYGVIEIKAMTAKEVGIEIGKEIKFLEYEDNDCT